MTEGPAIEQLTHRLSECPAELLAEIAVDAVVSDVIEDLGGPPLTGAEAAQLTGKRKGSRNHLRTVAVTAWLLDDPWFRAHASPALAAAARSFVFSPALVQLAALVAADALIADPDRREELARTTLQALALTPAGERADAAADRLTSLSSVDKDRVLRETRAQQERAKQIREEMQAAQAREAASRYSSE